MFKKMLMSMIFMTVLIVGGLLFYFNSTTGGLFGKTDSSSRGALAKTFEDDTYMYYLSETQIQQAIKTSTTTVDLIENFLLEEKQGEGSGVAFAYVETPYLTVVKEARKIYDYTGRRPVVEEVKPNLMDQYLPVHVRFYENKAYIYDVQIGQDDDNIQPYKVDNANGGTAKIIYLNVEKLDFSQPLTITTVDRIDSSQMSVFSLEFDEYAP
ncbi:hypothetical protein HXA34_15455 [Salipaludibacillus agaradhaerens]|nr:hypothetical protein [Salipaludibacillus agaradhaerens]